MSTLSRKPSRFCIYVGQRLRANRLCQLGTKVRQIRLARAFTSFCTSCILLLAATQKQFGAQTERARVLEQARIFRQSCQHSALDAEVLYLSKYSNECVDLFGNWPSCKSFKPKTLALAFHLGSEHVHEKTIQLWVRYVRAVAGTGTDFDIYFNTHVPEHVLTALERLDNVMHITVSRINYGMDISGFFHSLAAMHASCMQYDVIIKVHSKHDIKWAREVLDPLLGSTSLVKNMIRSFADDPLMGLAFGTAKDYHREVAYRNFYEFSAGDLNQFGFTLFHEDGILRELDIDLGYIHRAFVGGNLFAIRGEAIIKILTLKKIQSLRKSLNLETTFDENWFGILSRSYELAEIQRYDPVFAHAPMNSLVAHHGKGMLRDSQIEHAWERVLSYIIIYSGLHISAFVHQWPFLPITTNMGNQGPEQKRYSELFNEVACRSPEVRGPCLTRALAGECVMQPHVVGVHCGLECLCVHKDGGAQKLRLQLRYLLNTLHNQRMDGAFTVIAQGSQHYIDCLHTQHARRLLGFETAPYIIKSSWRLPLCSRIVGANASELFLSSKGDVIHVRNVHDIVFLSEADKVSPMDGYISLRRKGAMCKLELSLKFTFSTIKQLLLTVPCTDHTVALIVDEKQVALQAGNASFIWASTWLQKAETNPR